MKGEGKKKYVEKVIMYKQKKVEEEPETKLKMGKVQSIEKLEKEKPIFQQKNKPNLITFSNKTTVINVKVKFLRQMGYNNLENWLKNPHHVYIGRNMTHYVPGAVGSKWANPFKVDQFGREGCIEKYRQYILNNENLLKDLKQLKGKVLGCWCSPEGCHGDVLAELANKLQDK